MDKLIKLVIEWGNNRKFVSKENRFQQFAKLCEEYNEFVTGYVEKDVDEIKDAIGDINVVCILLCEMLEINFLDCIQEIEFEMFPIQIVGRLGEAILKKNKDDQIKHISFVLYDCKQVAEEYNCTAEECLELAYNVIKNREGKTVDGTFIKDE